MKKNLLFHFYSLLLCLFPSLLVDFPPEICSRYHLLHLNTRLLHRCSLEKKFTDTTPPLYTEAERRGGTYSIVWPKSLLNIPEMNAATNFHSHCDVTAGCLHTS